MHGNKTEPLRNKRQGAVHNDMRGEIKEIQILHPFVENDFREIRCSTNLAPVSHWL